jgi:hypothetical protein
LQMGRGGGAVEGLGGKDVGGGVDAVHVSCHRDCFCVGQGDSPVLTLRAASSQGGAKTDRRGRGQSQTPSLGSSQVLVAQ